MSALRVPNAPLREAFLASGKTASDVARSLGWSGVHGADTSRVRRKLGLNAESSTHGRRYHSHHIDIDIAEALADAIGVDRWEMWPQ